MSSELIVWLSSSEDGSDPDVITPSNKPLRDVNFFPATLKVEQPCSDSPEITIILSPSSAGPTASVTDVVTPKTTPVKDINFFPTTPKQRKRKESRASYLERVDQQANELLSNPTRDHTRYRGRVIALSSRRTDTEEELPAATAAGDANRPGEKMGILSNQDFLDTMALPNGTFIPKSAEPILKGRPPTTEKGKKRLAERRKKALEDRDAPKQIPSWNNQRFSNAQMSNGMFIYSDEDYLWFLNRWLGS